MVRTQIQLSAEQHRRLKEEARREHLSLSHAIRQAVELWLRDRGRALLIRRSIASMGSFRSGRKDISVHHDAYLAEIYRGSKKR